MSIEDGEKNHSGVLVFCYFAFFSFLQIQNGWHSMLARTVSFRMDVNFTQPGNERLGQPRQVTRKKATAKEITLDSIDISPITWNHFTVTGGPGQAFSASRQTPHHRKFPPMIDDR
jgi:hypothetical protein